MTFCEKLLLNMFTASLSQARSGRDYGQALPHQLPRGSNHCSTSLSLVKVIRNLAGNYNDKHQFWFTPSTLLISLLKKKQPLFPKNLNLCKLWRGRRHIFSLVLIKCTTAGWMFLNHISRCFSVLYFQNLQHMVSAIHSLSLYLTRKTI